MLLEKDNFLCIGKWQDSQGATLFLQEMKGNSFESVCKHILEIWLSLKYQMLKELFTTELQVEELYA